jgi:sugar phosphate permease
MKPSYTRYGVVAFAVSLAILSYIDRVAISRAAPEISRDLNLDKAQMGLILSAFGLGYALFEIPGGFLGDWLGPRKVIARIVLWWSAFTALTGMVSNPFWLRIVRFLFGCGEAGAFPVITKSFTVWLKPDEKSRAQGVLWTAARLGGAITPFLVDPLIQAFNWRNMFYIFGALGVLWAAVWWWWYRDKPEDHPQVNTAEAELLKVNAANAEGHTDVPWGKLLRSRSVWLLWAQYFCLSYPWYFYITWLPTYLKEERLVAPDLARQLAFLPLALGALGCFVCGFALKSVANRLGSVRAARRWMASIGFATAAMLLFTSTQTKEALPAMLLLGLSGFFNDLVMPPAWGTCMDIGGKYAGTVSGSMNMMGNLAGFAAPALGGYIVSQAGGSWNLFLYTMVGMYVLGAICWPFLDPETPIDQ